jgi:glycosyltransferase involved in cell wall biosynthesis
MIKEFINAGHTVIALGPDNETLWKDKFQEHNIEYRQFYVERNGMNPLKDLKTYIELHKFMKNEKPDKVFAYQAKTLVYGSIAARANGILEVYPLIAGLGTILRGSGFKNSIVKIIMKLQYWIVGKCSKKVFFHNNEDKSIFTDNGLMKKDKTVVLNGSGVNLEFFKSQPLPDDPAFLYIGRLIKDKGVIEYLEACKVIKKKYPKIRCMVVGPFDTNPSALKQEELQFYIDNNIIEYFGEQDDVRPFIAQCSTYVLPSYHEGRPKTVLEAMAVGRSIITSNAPGCRETIIDGLNGYLVEVGNVEEIASKMDHLICNPQIVKEMGLASLKIAKERYDAKLVNGEIIKIMELI